MKIEDKEYLRAAKKIWCGDECTIQNVRSSPNVGEIWKPKNLKEYYGIVKVDKYTVKIIGIGNELKTSMNLDDFTKTFEYYC